VVDEAEHGRDGRRGFTVLPGPAPVPVKGGSCPWSGFVVTGETSCSWAGAEKRTGGSTVEEAGGRRDRGFQRFFPGKVPSRVVACRVRLLDERVVRGERSFARERGGG